MVPKATLAGSNGILPGELIFAGEEAIALADKALVMMTKRYGRGCKTTLDALTGTLFLLPSLLLIFFFSLYIHIHTLFSYIPTGRHIGHADIPYSRPLTPSHTVHTLTQILYILSPYAYTLSLCLYPLLTGLADILDFFGGRDEAKAELAIRYYEEAIVLQERHGIEFVAYKKEQLSFICNKYVR